MADISKIGVGNTVYNIKDAKAREDISMKNGYSTWKNVSFGFYKIGRFVMVRAMGQPNVEIDGVGKYVAELIPYPSDEFKPASNYLNAVDFNTTRKGQFNATENGMQIGYLNEKIASGTTLYFSTMYISAN